MATKTLKSRIKNKRDTSANWTKNDPVLLDGEIIIVDTDAGETRYKIGDGTKKYSQLPFQDEAIRNLINGKLDKTATAADSSKLNGQEASYYAVDSDTVHKTGDENISGVKTFKGKINGTAGATIKSAGNAILNVQTVAAGTDYTHLYTSGGSNNNRPIVLNAASDGSGPVGIGVEQPTEKLEVAGNIKATGKVTVGAAPTADLDVATKKYVDDGLSDKQTKITANGILKGDGSGSVSAAIAGTDYDVPEVFYIEKANATHDKILSAYNSNKVIIVNDNNVLYQLDMYGGGHFIFSNFTKSVMYDLGLDNAWNKVSRNYININLNANQPMGQSSGDFWYQITTA